MDEGEGDRDRGAARPVPAHKAAKKVARSEETNSEDDEIDILGVSDDGEDRPPAQQPAPEGGIRRRPSLTRACAVVRVRVRSYFYR